MPTLITERDVRSLMARPEAMGEAIAAIEDSFRAQAEGSLSAASRVHVDYPPGGGGERSGRAIRVLPAIDGRLGCAAVRLYTMNKDGDPYRPAPSELLLVFDLATMQLESIIEDCSLHALRTGAPSGLATRLLARPDARRVGVIGTGRQARGQLAAVASVRRVESVAVHGRDAQRLQRFCTEMSPLLACPVVPAADAMSAVRDADIVITATNSAAPVLRGGWLRDGMHVNSVAPGELDEEAVLRSRVIQSAAEHTLSGVPHWSPFPELLARGAVSERDVSTELCDVVTGRTTGRESEGEVTLFINPGMSSWDVAIGAWVQRRTRELGLGRPMLTDAAEIADLGFMAPRPSPVCDGAQGSPSPRGSSEKSSSPPS